MVQWYTDLFLDGITKHTVEHIRDRVGKRRIQYPVFAVTYASNEKNLLDVININELLLEYYQKCNIYILGVASSRQQAKIMAAAIVSKVFEETNSFEIREYFENGF